jgi:hypothetical protein
MVHAAAAAVGMPIDTVMSRLATGSRRADEIEVGGVT